MKKLFISSLSLLLLLNSAEFGTVRVLAEENEPTETETDAETPAETEIPSELEAVEEETPVTQETPTEETPVTEETDPEIKEEGTEETPSEEEPAEKSEEETPAETEQPAEEAAETPSSEVETPIEETPEAETDVLTEEEASDAKNTEALASASYAVYYNLGVAGATWPGMVIDEGTVIDPDDPVYIYEYRINDDYRCPAPRPSAPGRQFLGWSRKADGAVDYMPGTTYSSLCSRDGMSMDMYAVWAVNVYTLNVNLAGGTADPASALRSSMSYVTDEAVADKEGKWFADRLYNELEESLLVSAPYKKGYTFAGYYTDSKCTNPFMIKEGESGIYTGVDIRTRPNNYTIYAKWVPLTIVVNYEFGGGAENPAKPNPRWYTVGQKVKLYDPIYDGYKFYGWYDNPDFTGEKITTLSNTGDSTDITLYARWISKQSSTFKLAYKLNGGSGKIATMNIPLEEGAQTVIKGEPYRSGYRFIGWNTKSKGNGYYYYPGERVDNLSLCTKKNKTVTLYAVWAPETFHITYETYGATENDNPASYAANGKNIKLKKPVKAGATFGGWYDNPYFTGTKISTIQKNAGKDYTLYAKWTVHKYQVVYNANGVSNAKMPAPKVYSYDQEFVVPGVANVKGYEFIGWTTKKKGTIPMYYPGNTEEGLTQKKNAVITLYAVFKPRLYYLDFYVEGRLVKNMEYKAGSTIKSFFTPTKGGMVFHGWYKSPLFTGSAVTSITATDAEDMDLHAYFTPENGTFTIKYNLNGASGSVENTYAGTGTYDSIYLKNAPSRYGYTFVGWTKKKDADLEEDKIYEAESQIINPRSKLKVGSASSITLYAQWVPTVYTITLHANADNAFFPEECADHDGEPLGTGSSMDALGPESITRTHKFGKKVKLTDYAVRPGYQLLGWSTDPKAVKATYLPDKYYTTFSADGKDIDLYAVWK